MKKLKSFIWELFKWIARLIGLIILIAKEIQSRWPMDTNGWIVFIIVIISSILLIGWLILDYIELRKHSFNHSHDLPEHSHPLANHSHSEYLQLGSFNVMHCELQKRVEKLEQKQ